jgi:hypothetical protein
MDYNKPKMLIEVALPVKEISAESVRDKFIRHGHISTLHLWWARRPLPVCRAVVFASLVPDPLDENCPPSFKDAVRQLFGPQEKGWDLFDLWYASNTKAFNSDRVLHSFHHYMKSSHKRVKMNITNVVSIFEDLNSKHEILNPLL